MNDFSVQKRIATIACIGVIGILSLEFGVVGILPQIAEYYRISIEQAGYLLSVFAITVALTGPFTVLFMSRFDKKKVMLLSMSLYFFSTLCSYFAPPFWLLLIVRAIPAVLHPVYFAMAIEASTEGVSKEVQIRHTSIIIGGAALAQVTTIPFSTFMASIFDWKVSYLSQSVFLLIAIVLIFFFIPNIKGRTADGFGGQLKILKKPSFIAGTLFNFMLLTSWFATYAYFADYLINIKNMSEQQVSYLLLLFGAMSVISNFATGRLLGKYQIITTVFFLSGVFLMPFILKYTGDSPYSVSAVVAVWGLMFGPAFLLGIFYGMEDAPEAKGFANSIQSSVGNMGVAIGTAVSGLFITSHTVAITPWIGCGLGVLTVLVFILYLYLRRKTKNKLILDKTQSL